MGAAAPRAWPAASIVWPASRWSDEGQRGGGHLVT